MSEEEAHVPQRLNVHDSFDPDSSRDPLSDLLAGFDYRRPTRTTLSFLNAVDRDKAMKIMAANLEINYFSYYQEGGQGDYRRGMSFALATWPVGIYIDRSE